MQKGGRGETQLKAVSVNVKNPQEKMTYETKLHATRANYAAVFLLA